MSAKRGRPPLSREDKFRLALEAERLLHEVQQTAHQLKRQGGFVEQLARGVARPVRLPAPQRPHGGWRNEAERVVAKRHGLTIEALRKRISRHAALKVVKRKGTHTLYTLKSSKLFED
jgi:hypothetical protein